MQHWRKCTCIAYAHLCLSVAELDFYIVLTYFNRLQGLETETKLSELSAALSVPLQQNCTCPLSIQQRFFSCLGTADSQTVVFLAQITYADLPGGMDVPSLITSWVASSSAILVSSIQLQVDTSCPVVIDSLSSKRCTDPPTNPPANPPTDFTVITIAVCIAVLLVVIIIVAAVVTVVVLCRKQSKYRYVSVTALYQF